MKAADAFGVEPFGGSFRLGEAQHSHGTAWAEDDRRSIRFGRIGQIDREGWINDVGIGFRSTGAFRDPFAKGPVL